MARVTASLVEWLDDKGYGFARQPGGAERIFIHAKAFATDGPRPKKGDEIELEIVPGRNGKPAGQDVRILSEREVSRLLPYHLVTAAMLFILAGLVVMLGHAPFGILPYYAVMGGVSAFLYSRDKQAALFGWWRISEATLLTVDFLGGIIGGLLAQHRYRHKMSKQSYQVRIFAIVAFHAAFLGALGSQLITAEKTIVFFRHLFGG